MAILLSDFVGTYTFRHGSGTLVDRHGDPLIRPGYQLCVGTGQQNDPAPDGIRIGISVVDPKRGLRVIPDGDHPPAYAYLVEGTLNGSSYWLEDTRLPFLLSYQISLMHLARADGQPAYRATTINVTIGDPHNAGVWGAEDSGDG